MMDLQSKNRAFTLVELLTVMAIITMLIGLLIPSLNTVRRFAKNTKQSAQLASIGAALTTFHNDYGEYPPSKMEAGDYCGAHKLCEALLGQDLMGFYPETSWSGIADYNPVTAGQRVGRYLELATANAFRTGDLYNTAFPLGADALAAFMLCDVFGSKTIRLANNQPVVKAGSPVLYYRANQSSRVMVGPSYGERIYNVHDSRLPVLLQQEADGRDHPLINPDRRYEFFYGDPGLGYIQDPRVPGHWPYRPDSYLLITAGADGLYGSGDDICNFGN